MTVPSDPRPVEWVGSEIIRQHFNAAQLAEKAAAGELKTTVKRASHPETPPAGEPVCTYSQIVYYYTLTGDPLAVVHQYLRPDGSIGASGRPDPKMLILDDRILAVRSMPTDAEESG